MSISISPETRAIVEETAIDLDTTISTTVDTIVSEWYELSNASTLDARATHHRLTELTERIIRLERTNANVCKAVRELIRLERVKTDSTEIKRTA
ncbi:hypothetical protein I4641_08600 [Waterburya agarophytonicola K14]|uniref:Uncharacterized protein n=1 Tax=Waterburya agarophytonicola KI4 TaxID=2874699 RepID=A0A964BP78_9CYAN|nr:hypothetical protein [Waterburya agarophytonicola]MCC0177034.1 hypothetical protein [Waterburya agarophytonicola KI4]